MSEAWSVLLGFLGLGVIVYNTVHFYHRWELSKRARSAPPRVD